MLLVTADLASLTMLLIMSRAVVRHMQACYEGAGMASDAQDALLWLSRAAKTLLASEKQGESICNMSTASLIARRNQVDRTSNLDVKHSSFSTPCSMPEQEVLAKAALLLGFLHLDGEATRFDSGEALRWFKVALLHDCPESERVIGTLFNTGQYG